MKILLLSLSSLTKAAIIHFGGEIRQKQKKEKLVLKTAGHENHKIQPHPLHLVLQFYVVPCLLHYAVCWEGIGTQDSREDEVEPTMFNQSKRGEETKIATNKRPWKTASTHIKNWLEMTSESHTAELSESGPLSFFSNGGEIQRPSTVSVAFMPERSSNRYSRNCWKFGGTSAANVCRPPIR